MAEQDGKCRLDVNDGRLRVECRRGMTLFAALRSRGVLLPTGCGARGKCAQCKVRVSAGEAGLFTDAEARLLSEEERALGVRLACQARVDGDAAIGVPEYVFSAREYRAVLSEVVLLTRDIRRFSFSFPDGSVLPHVSGQFLTLSARIPGAGQVMRCFSFANQSTVEDRVDIIARLNPDGAMTPYLFETVRPGDPVSIIGPYGDFRLRPGDAPCVWVAGGSGLSPFLGMLHDLLDADGGGRRVSLFFGAVLPEDLYYVDLLNGIAARNKWFSFTPALSGDRRCDSCDEYGLVTDVLERRLADASECEGYLCGSPGMIAACLKVLREKGMKRENIFYDRF